MGEFSAQAVLAVLSVMAMIASVGTAFADMRSTPHNLVRGSPLGELRGDDGEMCVFCHTPVISDRGVGHLPLWQRSTNGVVAYPTYDDIGRSGSPGSTAVGSQSLACLSCHDANQAVSITRSAIEHPYGVPYRGSFPSPSGQSTTIQRLHALGNKLIDTEFPEGLADFRPAYRGVIDGRPVWWASSSGNAARRGRGDLPLYARVDAESGVMVPQIECSTCHDPHSTNPLFLRTTADRGEICLTCHNN